VSKKQGRYTNTNTNGFEHKTHGTTKKAKAKYETKPNENDMAHVPHHACTQLD
jgi:hypothetical protein